MLVRDYRPEDRAAVVSLATRLTIGVAPWRDPAAVAPAVRGWVMSSITDAAVFVAHDDHTVLGFVTVAERRHFTGAVDAYVGELVTAEEAEGRGVGRALLTRAEEWAREQGYVRISLET